MLSECKKDGILRKNVLAQTPGYKMDDVRAANGPVVCIECAENIPCNPCETSCPQNAITVGTPITNLPVVDVSKCIGCGMCVAACPGLAIFLINANYTEDLATVTFAYEYLPVPAKGDKVMAVDREGNKICEAEVVKNVQVKAYDMTNVLTIAVPKEFIEEARGIAVPGRD